MGVSLNLIPNRVGTIGFVRMGATLIRGKDSQGHFGLLLPPETQFGAIEQARHGASFKKYLENFNEQLPLHEQNLLAA